MGKGVMATFGGGFLGTDSRKKQGLTGGSAKASQGNQGSMMITGDPKDGNIGFGDARAFQMYGGTPSFKPAPAPDPEYREQTASERTELFESRGVAETHDNMGSLSVDFRASEKAKTDSGILNVQDTKDKGILDRRKADEYKRTVTDPQNQRDAYRKAQQRAMSQFLGRDEAKMKARMAGSTSKMEQRSNSGNLGARLMRKAERKPASTYGDGKVEKGGSQSGLAQAMANDNLMTPNLGWVADNYAARAQYLKDNPEQRDLLATRASAAGSEAVGRANISDRDMLNAQSAGGSASPGQVMNNVRTTQERNDPNRRS